MNIDEYLGIVKPAAIPVRTAQVGAGSVRKLLITWVSDAVLLMQFPIDARCATRSTRSVYTACCTSSEASAQVQKEGGLGQHHETTPWSGMEKFCCPRGLDRKTVGE